MFVHTQATQWRKFPDFAPHLLADSGAQSRNSNHTANLPRFTTAQQWDSCFPRFDPSDRGAPQVRANALGRAAQLPKDR